MYRHEQAAVASYAADVSFGSLEHSVDDFYTVAFSEKTVVCPKVFQSALAR